MTNRWIEFVKKWASDNNLSYGCALSKPEMKEAYRKENPKINKLPKGVSKLQESKPNEDVKSKVTYPNLKIIIPEPEPEPEPKKSKKIQLIIEEDEPIKKSRGRPKKHMTAEDLYKSKLESNKLRRREKASIKKIKS